MKIGLSTAAFYGRYETEDAAKKMSRLPIDCAEVFLQSESEYTSEFARIVKENLGAVDCTSVHPLSHHERFMAQRPARQMRDAFETFERILRAGEILGAGIYVYHGLNTSLLKPLAWNLSWNIEAVGEMCARAAKRNMVIAWENVYWCQLTETERVLEAKQALPQVRFTLDIKQAMRAGCDPMMFIDAMGGQLSNVHVCDWRENGDICLPGEGIFDFDALFEALKGIGYQGPVILEPYLRAIKDDEALLRSIEYLRNLAAK